MSLSYPFGRIAARTPWLVAMLVAASATGSIARAQHASPIAICPETEDAAERIRAAIAQAIAQAPPALFEGWTLAFAPCSATSGSLVARSGTSSLARRVVFAVGTHAPTPAALAQAIDAIAQQLSTLRGVPRDVTTERAAALARPPSSTPPLVAAPPPDPDRGFLVVPRSSTDDSAPTPLSAEDPRNERFAVAVDGGLRLYQGSTGAYALRIRIGMKWVFFDYRLATISVAGLFAGDSARIVENSYGIGLRYRFRFGSRSTLSLGVAFYLGVARATGDSAFGDSSDFGTGVIDGRLDLVYELAVRAFRFRLGVDFGRARGIVLLAQSDDGSTHRIGGFDGFEFGLHAGVGLARLRGTGGR